MNDHSVHVGHGAVHGGEAVRAVGGIEMVTDEQVEGAIVAVEGAAELEPLLPCGGAVVVGGDGATDAIEGSQAR